MDGHFISGSRRWADSGVIDGTYQDAYAYFGSIEKDLEIDIQLI